MAMAYKDRELAKRITRYLSFVEQYIQVERAFLYGSYAYGVPLSRSDIDLVLLSRDFAQMDHRHRQEQLAIWAWQAEVGDIEALGLTLEEFEDASDLSLLGEVREKGVVVYDVERPQHSPAIALRERTAEYGSTEKNGMSCL
jgi:predicted nucleotidyltransferase